ncbi:DUF551 domain-containing protein [Escherichia coli]
MTTITDKKQYPSDQYLNELITNMEFAARAPVEVVRVMAAELQKRREADSAEPVSQTCKLPPRSSNEVNDAAWKLHNMLTEHGPLNGRQFNNLKGCFEAFKVAMRNHPVIPDSWISCSERMPDNNHDVLFFDVWGYIRIGWFSADDRSWFTSDDGCCMEVTHWMPLPEPPQEVNRG